MENTATGSSKLPYYPSKLQELLTADRCTRRSDLAETSSAASVSGDSLGDDGTNSSSDAMSDKYRNPRKRLLLSSMNASEADESPDDQSEKGKKMMKWKADGLNGDEPNSGAHQGPASFKVAPIVLKKYYPKAVQSAECEEFLVSLSEDVVHTAGNGGIVSDTKANNLEATASPVIKSKDDYEYMGGMTSTFYTQSTQIDKLLSMSSPKSSWKAPRRQRRFQCSECPKSYSTEDDLKSHVLSHSAEDAKPFECDQCDKKFKWVASLRVHKQKTHDQSRTAVTEDEGESSQEENSPSQECTAPEIDDKLEIDEVNPSVSVVINSNSAVSQQDHNQTFESVVNKMVSSGLVSTNPTVTIEKSLPPRRQCSNVKDVPPTRRSTPRKDSKSNSVKPKVINDTKKKTQSGPVADETDESASPQTPTTGRSSLRRNIQRPKWLSDADLVTDYEFPRGKTNSPTVAAAPSTVVVNGNQSQSRTMSTDSADDITPVGTPKSQKSDKNKSTPPTSRERKRKEEVDQSEPKKKEVSKRAEKKELLKQEKASKIKSTTRRNKQGESSETPPKQLSTKILTLTLEDIAIANHGTLEKLPIEKKNARKRTSNESLVTTVKSPESRKSKRKRSSEMEEKGKQMNGIDTTDANITLNTSATTNDVEDQTKIENLANGDVETATDNYANDTAEKSVPQEIELNAPMEVEGKDIPNETTEITDTKKPEEENVDSNLEETIIQEAIEIETNKASTDPCKISRKNSIDTVDEANNVNKSANEFNQLSAHGESTETMGSNCSTECETLNKEIVTLSSTPEAPFIETLGVCKIYVDIPEDSEQPPPVEDNSEVAIEDIKESKLDSEVIDRSELEVLPPIVCGNDEEMPILRPETSSSAAGSRSDSFAERMQSIDEDVSSSSNSNHSILPEAPVLSKQTTTFANGIVNVSEDCKAGFSGVVLDDNQGGLPLMDEEETEDGNKRLRRDRSDSLSVRSCGSGSQSEKIKALDDTTTPKDKRTVSDHECIVDSDDDNDSLMSEFSELAAQLSEKTDGVKFKEECIRFLTNKVSASSMWAIRKELKRLKKNKNYIKFGKLSPLAAVIMQEAFCQFLE